MLLVFHEYDLRGTTTGWMAVLAGIALLFNPLLPVGLSREQWAPIDASCAIVLVIHYLACKRLAAMTAVTPTSTSPQPFSKPRVRSPSFPDQSPPEPRWAHLLDRDDVLVLDTQTTGLDADAEVTDVAVCNTRGRVLPGHRARVARLPAAERGPRPGAGSTLLGREPGGHLRDGRPAAAVDRVIAGLLFMGGLRRSEAAALEWRDVTAAREEGCLLRRPPQQDQPRRRGRRRPFRQA